MKNQSRSLWRRAVAILVMALLLFAVFPNAMAQGADPSDAVLAPVTEAPWLAHPGTTPEPADHGDDHQPNAASGAAETVLPPPGGQDATQTASVLPAVLGLGDSTTLRVLLIGTDAYTVKQRGRSDTMLLFQINVQTGQIRLVSFLRDLYVKIPGHGKTRLNAAYVFGGAELLKQTLLNNFGVTVDRTVAVNFSLMVQVIDQIGGVTVDVSTSERKQLNSILKYYNTQNGYPKNDQLLESAGEQTLTGKQALCYSRIRKIDSDFQRVGRQRKVIEAAYARLRQLDALALGNLVMRVLPQIWTDMTLADAASLVPVLLKLGDVNWDSLTVPVNGGYSSQNIAGMDVLVPSLDRNRDAIAQFLQ